MKPITILASALLGIAALPASAAQFDFYKLGRGAVNGDFLPTNGVACTGGDLCSSNVDGAVFGGNLSFTDGGVTAVATSSFASGASSVVQDHDGGWTASIGAGLGVYHKTGDTSDDNITSGETLTITFDQVVTLTSVGLRAEGHNFTGWGAGKTFLLDGVQTTLPQDTGSIAVDMTGNVFTFAYGGTNADQFYLASLTVTPVPEPASVAMVLAGLGFVGVAQRRRTRNA